MHRRPISALTLQFLTWVAAAPRGYGDIMEAWRTTCPRMTVWEDAVSEGFVRLQSNGARKDCKVVLTERGRKALASQAIPPRREPVGTSARAGASRLS
jgi:hypothetical protein